MKEYIFIALKRFVLYPGIVGGIGLYLAFGFITDPADQHMWDFLTNIYKYGGDGFGFVSDQYYLYISFYFFGYCYGLVSKYVSVRKAKKGLVISYVIWAFKISCVYALFTYAPLILIGDILWISFNILKQWKQNKKPAYIPRHQATKTKTAV